MIDAAFPHKERRTVEHLQQNTAQRPNIDHGGVVLRAEDELGRPVASRANIWQVWLFCQYLC
jgi:hypothetical protein